MQKKVRVPPDGGWGWMVVFAYALNNLVMIPIMQSFGLIFKDIFPMYGISATDATIIINTNSGFGMLTGLINGPLLRRFTFRKVSIVAACLMAFGVISTSFARSFPHFLISYGLITSLGMGMGMSSYSLALNTYFKEKRGKATGFAMTVTGLGPIFMPQLISFLMGVYGVHGAVLIIGAIALHSLVASLLLQPVKWHQIFKLVDVEDAEEEEENVKNERNELIQTKDRGSINKINENGMRYNMSMVSLDHDVDARSIYGYDTPLPNKRRSSFSTVATPNNIHIGEKWFSTAALNTSHLGSSFKLNEKDKHPCNTVPEEGGNGGGGVAAGGSNEEKVDLLDKSSQPNNATGESVATKANNKVYDPDLSEPKPKKSLMRRFLLGIVNLFDLTLLKDPIYVNIMIGMSLAIFAELNFSLLTPFFLNDFKLSTQEIATMMSVIAGADIVFRFLAPYLADWLNKPPRVMYLISLLCLIVTRTTLLFVKVYPSILFVAVGLGIAKGVRTVFMTLVIPSYVPLERLASASGIQMVVNGVFLSAGGPFLGVIRDATGSYDHCILFINIITLATVLMWSVEILYVKLKTKKNASAIKNAVNA